MKHPGIMIGKQGYARKNRRGSFFDWAYLAKKYPDYREHIYRIRNNSVKLTVLGLKLGGI